jgi:hypothetical protein
MADVLTNDDMIERYFQSDDDESEFEGFSDNESDVDVPNALESSEDEHFIFICFFNSQEFTLGMTSALNRWTSIDAFVGM